MSLNLQILTTRSFSRWMRKNKVPHDDLIAATLEMAAGLIDTGELKALQELAKNYLALNAAETMAAIHAGMLIQLIGDE